MRHTPRHAAVAAISCLAMLTGATAASALTVQIRNLELSGGPTLVINDNDASDANPTIGLIDFSGAIPGPGASSYVISGLHANGRVGGQTYPDLYVSIHGLAWNGADPAAGLQIQVGDSGYLYQNNVVTQFAMSGLTTAGVHLAAESTIAYTNTDISFTTFDDQIVGGINITPGGAFDETASSGIAYRPGDPFAVQQVVRISGVEAGVVRMSMGTSPIPIGPTLPLMLFGLAGLGALRGRARA